jgi:hypothetical protein
MFYNHNQSTPIDIKKLNRVTMIPILKNSQNFILTCCLSADSMTIRLTVNKKYLFNATHE